MSDTIESLAKEIEAEKPWETTFQCEEWIRGEIATGRPLDYHLDEPLATKVRAFCAEEHAKIRACVLSEKEISESPFFSSLAPSEKVARYTKALQYIQRLKAVLPELISHCPGCILDDNRGCQFCGEARVLAGMV